MAKTNEELKQIATQVRRDILRMVCMAKSGHPGGSMGSTDILTTLYFNQMNQNPATWTRDGATRPYARLFPASSRLPVPWARA